jgi:hypothetical protein
MVYASMPIQHWVDNPLAKPTRRLRGITVDTNLTSTFRIDERDQELKARAAAQVGREMAQRQLLLERSRAESRSGQSE